MGIQAIFKRAELTCSLRTSDAGAARSLSRCLYLKSEELFGVISQRVAGAAAAILKQPRAAVAA